MVEWLFVEIRKESGPKCDDLYKKQKLKISSVKGNGGH